MRNKKSLVVKFKILFSLTAFVVIGLFFVENHVLAQRPTQENNNRPIQRTIVTEDEAINQSPGNKANYTVLYGLAAIGLVIIGSVAGYMLWQQRNSK